MIFSKRITLLSSRETSDGLGGYINEFVPAEQIYVRLYRVNQEVSSDEHELTHTNMVKFIALEDIEIGSFIDFENDIYQISNKIHMGNKYHYTGK